MTPAATQYLSALESANRVRLARAALKREIRSGEKTVGEVLLAEIPEWLERMTVGDLVQAVREIGPSRCRQLLTRVPCSERQEIGWLTMRQRIVIAEALSPGGVR